MNKGQLVMLNAGLERVIDVIQRSRNIKVKYLFIYNKDLISQECSRIKKLDNPSDQYKEFQNKRIKLNEKYSLKDDKGKAKIENNNFIIDPKMMEKFSAEMKDLEKEYEKTIIDRKEEVATYNKYLLEDVDKQIIENFKKIKISDIENEETLKDEPTILFEYLLPILEN